MHQSKNKEALADLKKSLELTSDSSDAKALIQEKIDSVKQRLEEQGQEETEPEIEEIPVDEV